MPDITICKNNVCPLSDNCYRYKATPLKYGQSYSLFRFKVNPNTNTSTCKFYIEDKTLKRKE